MRRLPLLLLPALVACLSVSCSEDQTSTQVTPEADAQVPVVPADAQVPGKAFFAESLTPDEKITSAFLSAPVDVVRDEWGVPHIYANNLPDASFAQGYSMAADRWIAMDFGRRQADGTLSEIVGAVNTAAIGVDFRYRMHRLRKVATEIWQGLLASSDGTDKLLVSVLKSFSAGVNRWQDELRRGAFELPESISFLYDQNSVTAWSEIDSLLLGCLQAFALSYDAESDILRTTADLAELSKFAGEADGSPKKKRVGFMKDYFRFAPFDKTYTVDGWGEARTALATKRARLPGTQRPVPAQKLALMQDKLRGAHAFVQGIGRDPQKQPERGSNNWVIGGQLSQQTENGVSTNFPMLANDTHLTLQNPPIFYLNHITTKDGFEVMGAQFPGIPLVILGMNRNVAWGSTVSYIDVTDVYGETLTDCDGGKCVTFQGKPVKLEARQETFKVGSRGTVNRVINQTYWHVPHHGPIIPKITGEQFAAISSQELSVRYTGHEPGGIFRAVYLLNAAKSAAEAQKALEDNFAYGSQNWVLADANNIAWTQTLRVPRRPAGAKPWKVLPGDGSAEWNGYFAPKDLPQAKNPKKGYLVTANADPLGLTATNDPGAQPTVDGYPLYMGMDYDPGTRVSRITKRIVAITKDTSKSGTIGAGGARVTPQDMESIQADAISDWGRALAPSFIAAANKLAKEAATPGSEPSMAALLATAKPEAKAILIQVSTLVAGWTYDTPSGVDATDAVTIADSKCAAIMAVFATKLTKNTMGDELGELGVPVMRNRALKVLGLLLSDTGKADLTVKEDLFDDISTAVVETKDEILAKSVLDTLALLLTADKGLGPDIGLWRWGNLHKATPKFFAAGLGLDLTPAPRHGGDGTVDIGSQGVEDDDYTYGAGPSIRFRAVLRPDGPQAWNVLPGGQVFRPASRHYQDLWQKWVKNESVALRFKEADVAAGLALEKTQNEAPGATKESTHRRFSP
jgi:penicillin G amidase